MTDTRVSTGTGAHSTGPFEDPTLTTREHMDPDKHLIGESLQAPSLQEVSVQSGGAISTGTSNIVARADHTHDTYTNFSQYYHGYISGILHGQAVYFNSWTPHVGQNILQYPGGQLFIFPKEGMWEISGGGFIIVPLALSTFSAPWMTIRLDFNNVTYTPYVVYQGIWSSVARHTFNFSWVFPAFSPVDPTINLQVMAENYTGQTASIAFDYFNLRRASSTFSL